MKTTRPSAIAGALLLAAVLAGCASPEEKQAEFLESARAYLAAGDEVLAEVELRNALRIDPTAPQALLLQARLMERRSAWLPMRDTLEALLERQPELLEANLMLGRLLLRAEAPEEATPVVERAVELAPELAEAWSLRAALHYQLRDFEAARQAAERARTLAPDDLGPLQLLANLDWTEGAYAQGLDRIAEGFRIDARDVPLHLLKMRIHLSLGEPDLAIAANEALIDLYPEVLAFRRSLALLHIEGDDAEAAEAVLRAAVEELPGSREAKLLLAQYLASNDPEAAIRELSRFVATEQDFDPTLAFRLAELHELQGDLEGAEAVYRDITASGVASDDGVRARNELARIAITQEDRSEAGEIVAEILAIDPDNPDALVVSAYLQLQQADVEEAIVNLRRAVRADPESVRAVYLLGRAYQVQGARGLARDTFARAVEIDPLQADSVRELVPYYLADARYAQADALLTRIIDADRADAGLLVAAIRVKLLLEEYDAAERLALRAAAELGNPDIATFVRGVSLRGQGQDRSALEVFESLLQRDPLSGNALTALVDAHVALDQREQALALLRRHIDTHPDFMAARNLLARELARAEEWPKAVEVLEAAISRAPTSLDAYVNLAQGYALRGDASAAAETYLRALDEEPRAVRIRLALASLYEASGEIPAAAEQYESVLAQQPGLDVAANNLAVILSGDPARLDEAYELVRSFEQSRRPALLDTVGWIQVRRGEHLRGAELLQRAYEESGG
ncbi:MAG: tetratricopeptide repeat protein, partial [Pseudomonadales bacterium]|nr:tetratricopeptide repeat protein [Pseudomonadales bacterium]